MSKADKGIVLSESLKRNLNSFIDENKIYPLANFAEDMLFGDGKIKPIDKLHILYLSNLMPEKGILDFLDALLLLKQNNLDFNAKIAGKIDVKIENKIQQMMEKLGNKVEYLGIIREGDKKNALQNSNVFVLPSKYKQEGQPIAVLEAMATGNVILVTDIGGVCDIFEEGKNGFYINKEDPQDIAEKLIMISKNLASYQKIMLYNHQVAEQRYRVKNFITDFIKILDD